MLQKSESPEPSDMRIAEYRRQFAWRSWRTVLEALPSCDGHTVLDLGCGVGDIAAEFASRGARVIGIDSNPVFVEEARRTEIPNALFHCGDLRVLPPTAPEADGIWVSFSTAYFVNLPEVLAYWSAWLRPGGWIALTEIDDLFGHHPLSSRVQELFEIYVNEALATGRYDLRMGRKLRPSLEAAGYEVTNSFTVPDTEFSFQGAALPEVAEAWRVRFARMPLLQDLCGAEWEAVRDEFNGCLQRPDHRSTARVEVCIAKPAVPRSQSLMNARPAPQACHPEPQAQP